MSKELAVAVSHHDREMAELVIPDDRVFDQMALSKVADKGRVAAETWNAFNERYSSFADEHSTL